MALAGMLPAQTLLAPAVLADASPACPGYASTTQPPDYIRVYRNAGRVDKVPFKRYVLVVLGKEWPGYLPQELINAGAVAVKEYAWYHALHPRVARGGACFDVTDTTSDQLYKPGRSRITSGHYLAVNVTWGIRLDKAGSLFMTGYRTGVPRPCGSDATGWKLFARSALKCAYRGDDFQQILRTYYGPVSIVGGSSSATAEAQSEAVPFSTPQPASATPDTTVNAAAGATGGVSTDLGQIGERAFTSA